MNMFLRIRSTCFAAALCLAMLLAPSLFSPASAGPLWTADGVPVYQGASSDQLRQKAVGDGAGGAVVVWMENRTGTTEIFAQCIDEDGQVQWGANGVLVSTGLTGRNDPQVIATGTGFFIVTWVDGRGLYDNVYAQKLNVIGVRQWENGSGSGDYNGIPVCSYASHMYRPVLASDGIGGAIIAWEDNRGVIAQHVLSNGTLDTPTWPVDGRAVATAAGTQRSPRIVPDGDTGAVITWEDTRRTVGLDRYEDVYAQKLTGGGNRLWGDGGVEVNRDAYTDSGTPMPELVSDGYGGAIITWQDYRSWPSPTWTRVYAQRVPSAGVPSWTANGVRVANTDGNQGYPLIAAHEDSPGAIIAWQDGRGTASNIYAQSVSLTGVMGWGGGAGVPVYDTSSPQYGGRPVSDGAGGAVIAWDELRGGSPTTSIYAQKLDATGSPQWDASGFVICEAPNDRMVTSVVRDGGD